MCQVAPMVKRGSSHAPAFNEATPDVDAMEMISNQNSDFVKSVAPC